MITREQVEQILADLTNHKLDAQLDGDDEKAEAISRDLSELQVWLDVGMSGPCPVDFRKYGIDEVTKKPAAQPADELLSKVETDKPDPQPAEEILVDQVDQNRQQQLEINRLLSCVRQAIDDGDLMLAESYLRDLQGLDHNNECLSNLFTEIKHIRREKEIQELIDSLENEYDNESLYHKISLANEMLVAENHPKLQEAKERAYQRYEERKRLQNMAATSSAIDDYSRLNDVLTQLEHDIADGQRKWYFRGEYRDIDQVFAQLKEQQTVNATRLATNILNKAKYYMRGNTRSPHVALETLNAAFLYKEMSSEILQELYKVKVEWEREAQAYDQADVELSKGAQEINPFTQLQHIRQATILYPYHPNLDKFRSDYLRGAVAAAIRESDQAVERVEQHLKGEEAEAVERVRQNDRSLELKVFADARGELEVAHEKINSLDDMRDHLETKGLERLQSALLHLDEISSRILERESRRKAIISLYFQILDNVVSGAISQAKQLYIEAPSDLRSDPVLQMIDYQINKSEEQQDQIKGQSAEKAPDENTRENIASDSQAKPEEQPAAQPVASSQPVDEVGQKRQQQNELKRLLGRAQEALNEKDLLLAEGFIRDAEAIDASSDEAAKLRKELYRIQEQRTISELIVELNRQNDIEALYALIQRANDLLTTKQHPDLSVARDYAYERYEEKKRLQGQMTTQEAMESYSKVQETIRQLNNDIADGQKKWYFRGEYRDIDTVSTELKTQQTINATRLALRVLEKAKYYVSGSSRSPHVALSTLEGAFQYVEMASETLQELNKTQAEWEREAEDYDKADTELEKAAGEINPFKRLQHFRQAATLYSYHPNLSKFRADYLRGATAAASQEVDRAISLAEQHLKGEEAEAVEKATRNDRATTLKVFIDARAEIESAREKVHSLDDVLIELEKKDQDRLQAVLVRLDQMFALISERETRRNTIRTRYLQIYAQLQQKGNAQLGKQLYLETDAYLRSDPVLALIAPRIEGMLSDTDRLQEAEDFLRRDNWSEVLDKARQVKDSRLSAQKDRLMGLAYLHLWEISVRDLWGRGYYEDADRAIEQIMSYDSSIQELSELRDNIISRLDLDNRRIELQERRRISDENRIQAAMDRLKADLPVLSQTDGQINVFKKGDATLDRIMGIYQRICEIEKLESSYYGPLHDWKRRIEAALLTQLIGQLELLKDHPGEKKRAFRYAQILWKNGLTEESAQTELCRNAILAYYEDQNQPLKDLGEWETLLRNWETAVKDFGGELISLGQTLTKLRHEYLLICLDRALENLDQVRASQILQHQINPCVFDTNLKFHYDVEADPELQIRQSILRIFEDADVRVKAENYEEAVAKMGEKRASLPDTVRAVFETAFNRKIKQVRDLAITQLRTIGDISELPIPTRTYAFARILGFDKENADAATWMEQNSHEVRFEIDQKVTQGGLIEIGPEPVQEQLDHIKELLDSLKSFSSVCDTLRWLTKEQVDRAIAHLEVVLKKLQRANSLLNDYSPKGSKWQGVLRTGEWTRMDDDLEELRGLLEQPIGDHQQVAELATRKSQASVDRERMTRAKNLLDTSFNTDDFKTGLDCIADIDRILFQYTGNHIADVNQQAKGEEPDPFRIVLRGYQIFDVFENNFVPFFENGSGRTVFSLLKIRQENYLGWNNLLNALKTRFESIGKAPEPRKPYTLIMKETLKEYLLAFHEEKSDRLAAELKDLSALGPNAVQECPEMLPWMRVDLPEPNSLKTRNIRTQVYETINQIIAQLRVARANWIRIYQYEQEMCAELDDLERNFTQGPDTMTRITTLAEYYENSQNKRIQTYLNHLRQRAIEQLGRRGRW